MNKVQKSINEMAKDLHAIGAIGKAPLKFFGQPTRPVAPTYSETEISLGTCTK